MCLLYLSGGVRVHHGSLQNAQAVEAGRSLIRGMEQAALPVIEERARPKQGGGAGPAADEDAEKARILAMQPGDVTAGQLQAWYRDTALVGDSMAAGARSYRWLDEAVYAEVGTRANEDNPLLDKVEARQPEVIILTYGINDVAVYEDRIGVFIAHYGSVLIRLRASCPNSRMYVTAIMPVSEAVAAEKTYPQYIDAYNETLADMCRLHGVGYIDARFILEQRPELYSDDGLHFNLDGYPLWLTYLADEAGISYYDDENGGEDSGEAA